MRTFWPHEDETMSKPQSFNKPFFALLAILICWTIAAAQNNKGAIVGTIKDPNDALVTNAKVKVTSVKTGEVRDAETTSEGTYTITNLEPGTYNVTADAPGFQTVTINDVQVETNARLPLDVKFGSVTGGGGTVIVTSEA